MPKGTVLQNFQFIWMGLEKVEKCTRLCEGMLISSMLLYPLFSLISCLFLFLPCYPSLLATSITLFKTKIHTDVQREHMLLGAWRQRLWCRLLEGGLLWLLQWGKDLWFLWFQHIHLKFSTDSVLWLLLCCPYSTHHKMQHPHLLWLENEISA